MTIGLTWSLLHVSTDLKYTRTSAQNEQLKKQVAELENNLESTQAELEVYTSQGELVKKETYDEDIKKLTDELEDKTKELEEKTTKLEELQEELDAKDLELREMQFRADMLAKYGPEWDQ